MKLNNDEHSEVGQCQLALEGCFFWMHEGVPASLLKASATLGRSFVASSFLGNTLTEVEIVPEEANNVQSPCGISNSYLLLN